MKTLIFTAFALLMLLPIAFAPNSDSAVRRREVVNQMDIKFGSSVWYDGVERDLLLDAYLPIDIAETHPAIVLIHGGGFRIGHRKDKNLVYIAQEFAERGFVVVSPDYRLDPNTVGGKAMATSPQATEAQWDTAKAVRWLRANAAEYKVDPTKIFAMGSSAGGITAQRLNHNAADWQSRTAAGISMWGGIATSMIEMGNPPSLFFHGLADTVLDDSLSRDACQTTLNKGNICRGVWWEGVGHGAWDHSDEMVATTISFLTKHGLI